MKRALIVLAFILALFAITNTCDKNKTSVNLTAIKDNIKNNTDLEVEEVRKSGEKQDVLTYRFLKRKGYEKILIATIGHEKPHNPDIIWRERDII